MDFKQIKRSWLISDIHFGVRASSHTWIDIHKSYFYDFFIPTLKENYQDGDALFVLGDVFESRQYVNIYVLNTALQIFKEINKILPIIMIVGNHDIYKKHSNDINSLEIFRDLPNIKILTNPEKIKFQSAEALFMPWQESHEKEDEVISNFGSCDYLFCHTDIYGFRYNKKVLLKDGLSLTSLSDFKKVYTGHIHFSQDKLNVRMIGSPIQITRSDMGNKKSVWLIDLASGEEIEFINTTTPKFIKVRLNALFDFTVKEINKKFHNNFVDVYVSDDWSTKFDFNLFSELITDFKEMEFILIGEDTDIEKLDVAGHSSVDIPTLIDIWVDSLNVSDSIKDELKTKGDNFYQEALKKDLE